MNLAALAAFLPYLGKFAPLLAALAPVLTLVLKVGLDAWETRKREREERRKEEIREALRSTDADAVESLRRLDRITR